MTKSKHTARALTVSVLSMILCVAMLIGSTFAWFTDSVTSGQNKIVAGNLDVELYHSNGAATDEKVGADTNLFVNKDGSAVQWEPGVMVYENFTVRNVGSLALKYRLTMNVGDFNTVDEGKSLKDVLKVAILDGAFSGDRTDAEALTFNSTVADFVRSGNLTATGDTSSDTYAVVIYWEPTADDNAYNLSNGKTSSDGNPLFIDLGIDLSATQDAVENDSFGNTYDADAAFPVLAANFADALTKGGSLALTEDVTIPNAGSDPEIITMADGTVLDLNGKTVSSNNMGLILQGKNATVKNGNFAGLNGAAYALFVGDMGDTDTLILENLTMQGGLNVYNASKVILRDCEIHGGKWHTVWADNNAQVIIESGTYYLGTGASSHVLWTAADTPSADGGDYGLNEIIVKGGSFEQDPTPYVDTAAYDVTLDTATNMYVVTPKA